jgi:hypothetical protein
MKFKNQLFSIIKEQPLHIEILKTVRDLKLNDCWIGAGFIRNTVWNILHGIKNTEIDYDIDVVFYYPENSDKNFEKELENKLISKIPYLNWSVKNQARMHLKNGHKSYADVFEAISHWPETATSIAIKIDDYDNLQLIASYGLEDLFNFIVKPTPEFDTTIVEQRILEKKWLSKWPKLNYQKNLQRS